SEITPAVRSLTDSAMRTLVGAEVAREFYAVPQRYLMGAPESFFLDEDGNPRGAWDAMMGKILAIERDEETGDVPTVGSFAAIVCRRSLSSCASLLSRLRLRARCRMAIWASLRMLILLRLTLFV